MGLLEGDGAGGKQQESGDGTEVDASLDPDLVEHLAETIEATPDDKVPAGSVPPAAYDLCRHGVHVGGDKLAGIGFDIGVDGDVEEEYAQGDTYPDTARK